MVKRNNGNYDEDEWGDCPECGDEVKSKNMKHHFQRAHPELSKEEVSKHMKSQKSGTSTRKPSRSERRKDMELEKRRKNTTIAIMVIIIMAVVIVAGYFLISMPGPEPEEQEFKEIKPTGKNQVSIPISEVDDGQAHFYKYDSNGVKIKYFVLKSSDGVIRAAFDTCDVCYDAKLGYRQEGDRMVCNNCEQEFASVRINEEKGGCNPAPLDRTVNGDNLIIKINDLEKGRWYFE
jgi:uncharacterized membrane protein